MIRLGVDGGGTKTAYCLLDADDRELGRAQGPGSYLPTIGIDALRANLADGIREVCDVAGVGRDEIDAAFFGLPGYGESPADDPLLDDAPSGLLERATYRCGNDMVCAWAGSLDGADGINVVAGTGSIAYGERDGRTMRVGGWSEVFGDEGSAHWIGVEGLRAASRMSDGRAARGPLLTLMREALEVTRDLEMIDVVVSRWHAGRERIAGLSRVVDAAARAGDADADAILSAAAGELAGLVLVARDGLRWPADQYAPVSWSGGVFASDRVASAFRALLAGASVELRRPVHDPAHGAALLAGTYCARSVSAE